MQYTTLENDEAVGVLELSKQEAAEIISELAKALANNEPLKIYVFNDQ